MVDKFISLMILLSQIFYLNGSSLRKSEIVFFQISTIGLFIASSFDKPKRDISILPFIILLSIAVLQLFIFNLSAVSMLGALNIFLGIIGLHIIARYSNGLNKIMLEMIILAGLINIVMTIGQNFGYSPIIQTASHTFDNELLYHGGFMGNAPRLGTYLAITFPLVIGYSWIAGIAWLLASVYIHQFPAFFVGFIMAMAWSIQSSNNSVIANKFRKEFLFLPAIIFTGLCIWQHQHILKSIAVRLDQWQPIIEQIFQHATFGLGIGMYQVLMNSQDEVCMSSLIEFFHNFGFIAGGIVLYFFIKDFLKSFVATAIQISVISFAALCIFEYPFEIPRFWPLIVLIGGIYLIEKTKIGELNGKIDDQS